MLKGLRRKEIICTLSKGNTDTDQEGLEEEGGQGSSEGKRCPKGVESSGEPLLKNGDRPAGSTAAGDKSKLANQESQTGKLGVGDFSLIEW